jgi:hypothetical protein
MNATNQCGVGTLHHSGLPGRESFHEWVTVFLIKILSLFGA